MSFASKLLEWYGENGRELPWRNTQDPYVIWLSEIILQQTRVEQGMPYFYRFLETFPIVTKLAAAEEEKVLRLWQGLGYYSRARNMHKAAKMVISDFGGVFPTKFADLVRLPGVGDYTAAAIASFSSNEAKAVVDGNVYRVLSRYFGISEPINSTNGKKMFAEVAHSVLDKERAGLYNQAIMDFGALQCKPKNPLCENCIFRLECIAHQKRRTGQLPVKIKGRPSKIRYFHYFVVCKGEQLLMARRGEGDVWANLYEFPLLETDTEMPVDELTATAPFTTYFHSATELKAVGPMVKHVLSHQHIYARFYLVKDARDLKVKKSEWDYFFYEKIDTLAKHKLIFSFLEKNKQLISPKL